MKTVTVEQDDNELQDILARIPTDTPVTMLNLLKYSDVAKYPENFEAQPCSGKHAYTNRYLQQSKIHLANLGATILFEGPVCASLLAPETEEWDSVIIVTYPSIEIFLQMGAAAEYEELLIHRAAGLEDARLIALVEGELADA